MNDTKPSALSRFLTWLPLIAIIGLPFLLDLGALAAEPAKDAAAAVKTKPTMLENLMPIGILLVVIGFVLYRLPKADVGHTAEFKRRRIMNWLPLGLTYSFLYMGRYNLTVAKTAFGGVMDNDDFSIIFMVGTIVYGFSFIINGPLTDKFGGRFTIMVSAIGSSLANLGMGLVTMMGATDNLTVTFSILYGVNMYFQSFGAVAIVKVNAPWFHVKERGTFGAIFGILISLGIYFAYDWGRIIVDNLPLEWVFLIPTIMLLIFLVLDYFFVRDSPADAGLTNFDPGDSRVGEDGPRMNVWQVFRLMFSQRVIVIISLIEFCSGYLRQSIMQYMPLYAKQTGRGEEFVFENWGVFLCCAGILGGMFAGVISDRVFDSRRGPVSAVLYGIMVLGGIVTIFTYDSSLIGPMAVIMSMAIIGVHGMLSGTASMDFGGRKNTGIAVGIIDGFVYLGTGTMALVNAIVLPSAKTPAAKDPENWMPLFVTMIPIAVIGLLFSTRVWNARARGKGGH
jgi:OPA family glycerol-3-phosphate transporter-like MFS transporter